MKGLSEVEVLQRPRYPQCNYIEDVDEFGNDIILTSVRKKIGGKWYVIPVTISSEDGEDPTFQEMLHGMHFTVYAVLQSEHQKDCIEFALDPSQEEETTRLGL